MIPEEFKIEEISRLDKLRDSFKEKEVALEKLRERC